jgi:hypothetical protein
MTRLVPDNSAGGTALMPVYFHDITIVGVVLKELIDKK